MSVDPIAAAGLFFTIVGAGAAVLAAKYAKGSATQAGLELVARNTAEATEEIMAVRSHIAQVDEHLRIQNGRESSAIAALRTSITVSGEGWQGEPMKLLFKVTTQGVRITSVDFINEQDRLFGSSICDAVEPGAFGATVNPTFLHDWFLSGRPVALPNRAVYVRANLDISGHEAMRKFSIIANCDTKGRPEAAATLYYNVAGKC